MVDDALLIDYPPEDEEQRSLLLQWASETPLTYGPWRSFKRLYKQLEAVVMPYEEGSVHGQRDTPFALPTVDVELLGLILARLDNALPQGSRSNWRREPTFSDRSSRTLNYMKRRGRRLLRWMSGDKCPQEMHAVQAEVACALLLQLPTTDWRASHNMIAPWVMADTASRAALRSRPALLRQLVIQARCHKVADFAVQMLEAADEELPEISLERATQFLKSAFENLRRIGAITLLSAWERGTHPTPEMAALLLLQPQNHELALGHLQRMAAASDQWLNEVRDIVLQALKSGLGPIARGMAAAVFLGYPVWEVTQDVFRSNWDAFAAQGEKGERYVETRVCAAAAQLDARLWSGLFDSKVPAELRARLIEAFTTAFVEAWSHHAESIALDDEVAAEQLLGFIHGNNESMKAGLGVIHRFQLATPARAKLLWQKFVQRCVEGYNGGYNMCRALALDEAQDLLRMAPWTTEEASVLWNSVPSDFWRHAAAASLHLVLSFLQRTSVPHWIVKHSIILNDNVAEDLIAEYRAELTLFAPSADDIATVLGLESSAWAEMHSRTLRVKRLARVLAASAVPREALIAHWRTLFDQLKNTNPVPQPLWEIWRRLRLTAVDLGDWLATWGDYSGWNGDPAFLQAVCEASGEVTLINASINARSDTLKSAARSELEQRLSGGEAAVLASYSSAVNELIGDGRSPKLLRLHFQMMSAHSGLEGLMSPALWNAFIRARLPLGAGYIADRSEYEALVQEVKEWIPVQLAKPAVSKQLRAQTIEALLADDVAARTAFESLFREFPAFAATFVEITSDDLVNVLSSHAWSEGSPLLEAIVSSWFDTNLQNLNRDDEALLLAATSEHDELRRRGLARLKTLGLNVPSALRLLEAGLPETQAAARAYFERDGEDLPERVTALCDSPSSDARAFGLELLGSYAHYRSDEVLRRLSHSGDSRIQAFVAAQLEEGNISDEAGLRNFEVAVLQGRGRSRQAKEHVKKHVKRQNEPGAHLPGEHKEAVGPLRNAVREAARTGAPRDREWALSQLVRAALNGQEVEGLQLNGAVAKAKRDALSTTES